MVEQVDREAAVGLLLANHSQPSKLAQEILAGVWDTGKTFQAFAAHRIAAEKAERERIADWLDGGGGRAKALAAAIRALGPK